MGSGRDSPLPLRGKLLHRGVCTDGPTAHEWSQLEWLSIATGPAGLVVLAAVALRRPNLAITAFAVFVGCAFAVYWLLEPQDLGDSASAPALVLAALVSGSIGIALTPRRR